MNENKKLGRTNLNRGVFVKHEVKSVICLVKVDRNEIKLIMFKESTMFRTTPV